MGAFARDVQEALCETLAERRPGFGWRTEVRVGRTPVDVFGERSGQVVLVEFEARRADPANNAVKLFRHVAEGTLDADETVVCQVFSAYYGLDSGGVSSKREDAEFIGEIASDALAGLEYHAVEFPVEPPVRDGDPPEGWRPTPVGRPRRSPASYKSSSTTPSSNRSVSTSRAWPSGVTFS